MADTNGVTLSPPPFREQLSSAQTRLLTAGWQRWLERWWQQHTALWHQGQGGTWQPLDPTLTALAALTGTADTVPYFSGTDVMAVTGLSAYSRTLLDDGDGGTWRSTLGLGTLSVQNANAVAITGGTASGLTTLIADSQSGGTIRFDGPVGMGAAPQAGVQLTTGTAPSYFGGTVQVAGTLTVVGASTLGTLRAGATYLDATHVGPDTSAYWFTASNAAKPGGGPFDNITSSAALKQQIRPLTGALASMLRLQGRQWEWRDEQSRLRHLLPGTQTGFVLEEVEAAMPHWVRVAPTGEHAYVEAGFPAYVVEAFRELTQRVIALEEQAHVPHTA